MVYQHAELQPVDQETVSYYSRLQTMNQEAMQALEYYKRITNKRLQPQHDTGTPLDPMQQQHATWQVTTKEEHDDGSPLQFIPKKRLKQNEEEDATEFLGFGDSGTDITTTTTVIKTEPMQHASWQITEQPDESPRQHIENNRLQPVMQNEEEAPEFSEFRDSGTNTVTTATSATVVKTELCRVKLEEEPVDITTEGECGRIVKIEEVSVDIE